MLAAGQNGIGALVGRSNASDLYAAAGSVLVLMLWVYYASAIFLFGAAFAIGRSVEDTLGWTDRIKEVTVEDINKVARSYLDPKRSTTGILLPAPVKTAAAAN